MRPGICDSQRLISCDVEKSAEFDLQTTRFENSINPSAHSPLLIFWLFIAIIWQRSAAWLDGKARLN
jgi:hypothetical protein